MQGYLLDTNIIRSWFDAGQGAKHEAVCRRIEGLPAEAPLRTSAIVVGEIEYGYRCAPEHKRAALEKLDQLIRRGLPMIVEVTRATAETYGDLRARLFEKFAPKTARRGLRPEQLSDPLTALALGIQENDLWIAAQAIERHFILVTNDQMRRIREIAPEPELAVEDWALTSGSSGQPPVNEGPAFPDS
jgi:predicted nucleic acid-binding protein